MDDLLDSFSSSKQGELFDIFKKYGKTSNTTKSAGVKYGEFNDAISQLDLTDLFGKDAPSATSDLVRVSFSLLRKLVASSLIYRSLTDT